MADNNQASLATSPVNPTNEELGTFIFDMVRDVGDLPPFYEVVVPHGCMAFRYMFVLVDNAYQLESIVCYKSRDEGFAAKVNDVPA